jgi:hypothetical protein
MGIHGHNLPAPKYRTHNICGLTAHTLQRLKVIGIGGNLATKAFDNLS